MTSDGNCIAGITVNDLVRGGGSIAGNELASGDCTAGNADKELACGDSSAVKKGEAAAVLGELVGGGDCIAGRAVNGLTGGDCIAGRAVNGLACGDSSGAKKARQQLC